MARAEIESEIARMIADYLFHCASMAQAYAILTEYFLKFHFKNAPY